MNDTARQWQTKWTKTLPLQAVLASVVAIVLAWLTVLVTSLSDGRQVGSWTISPSVYLAILATCTNALLRFVFSEGAIISWWNLSLRGATVRDLHKTWTFSESFWSALGAKSPFSSLRFASIAVTLLVLDGPILQRASTVGQVNRGQFMSVVLPFRSEPLWNLTMHAPIQVYGEFFQPEFRDLVSEYNRRADIKIPAGLCEGQCSTRIMIGGFDRNCTSMRQDMRKVTLNDAYYTALGAVGFPNAIDRFHNATYQPTFQIFTRTYNDVLDLLTILRDQGTGTDVLVRECSLTPALVTVDLDIVNTTVTIRRGSMLENSTVELTPIDDSYGATALGGFARLLQDQYAGVAAKDPLNGRDPTGCEAFYGASAYTYLNQTVLDQIVLQSDDDSCRINKTWIDPLPDYFASLEEMTVRYALKPIPQTAARLVEYTKSMNSPEGPKLRKLVTKTGPVQTVVMKQSTPVIVYRTNHTYLGVALGIMLVATCTISWTLVGWHRLGRKFSVSPFEFAKAFNAPLLRDAGSNMNMSDTLKIVGDHRIQYGVACTGLGNYSQMLQGVPFAAGGTVSFDSARSQAEYGYNAKHDFPQLVMLHGVDANAPQKGEKYY